MRHYHTDDVIIICAIFTCMRICNCIKSQFKRVCIFFFFFSACISQAIFDLFGFWLQYQRLRLRLSSTRHVVYRCSFIENCDVMGSLEFESYMFSLHIEVLLMFSGFLACVCTVALHNLIKNSTNFK